MMVLHKGDAGQRTVHRHIMVYFIEYRRNVYELLLKIVLPYFQKKIIFSSGSVEHTCTSPLLLTGAVTGPHPGKYQMKSIVRNNSVQLYVMDTTTGKVKWVKDMNVTFDEMK